MQLTLDYRSICKSANGATNLLLDVAATPIRRAHRQHHRLGAEQFAAHYGEASRKAITKDAIFHYVYGVLHDPIYRETYALNLKREFPRIPFYPDFWQWADWGEALMELHIGYEDVEPWPLERIDVPDEKSRQASSPPKPALKADKDAGIIVLDSETQLTGVPPKPGPIGSAIAPRSNGSSTSTRKRRRRTRPSATNSTPIASPITRTRWSIS